MEKSGTGDIIGVMVDLAKYTLSFYKNGQILRDLTLPKDATFVPVVGLRDGGKVSLEVKDPPKM